MRIRTAYYAYRRGECTWEQLNTFVDLKVAKGDLLMGTKKNR